VELSRLQVGNTSIEAKFIASTIPEIEHLVPLLKEYQDDGRRVNILYGIPLPTSQISRLARIGKELGPGSISVLVDHPAQVEQLSRFYEIAQFPPQVFIKIDTGYHRAGLPPSALNKNGMLGKLSVLEAAGHAAFLGLYSHSSLSYNDTTPKHAMNNLAGEIDGCIKALEANGSSLPQTRELTISVGASPQVVSIRNLTAGEIQEGSSENNNSARLRATIRDAVENTQRGFRVKLELHAGVYAVLDMQQLSTNARPAMGKPEEEVAVSVVAEVCSVYNDGERQQPEALVAVGTLGLGREPCRSYGGWGLVEPLGSLNSPRRLIVDRISQEHSIISWELAPDEKKQEVVLPPIPLTVGQPVRIYPNHACVTGAMYGWYLVVDSSQEGNTSKVVDIWIRASGW
jgi:D-serine ammonia-lyase